MDRNKENFQQPWPTGAMARLLLLILLTVGSRASAVSPSDLPVYQTPYYVMHTDLDLIDAREAGLRMTRMAEDYHERTAAFSGQITRKLPFYLFKNEADYYAAGGMPGTAGMFDGQELMGIARPHDPYTWHVIQHEGFHQFVHAVIRGEIPTWLNEGLAEYFGEGVFTGDMYVDGIIRPQRLRQIKAELRRAEGDGGFQPIDQMMQLSHAQWNAQMSNANYDQAWSMVYFLVYGDNHRYQQALDSVMQEVGRGTPFGFAWRDQFGNNAGFEQRWRAYWLALPSNPTDELMAKATVATLTSYLARANLMRQTFTNFAAFEARAANHTLAIPNDDNWLPNDLLDSALRQVQIRTQQGATFSLQGPSQTPSAAKTQVMCALADGTRLLGSYTWRQGYGAEVKVNVFQHSGVKLDEPSSE